jgi:hypothetical protein
MDAAGNFVVAWTSNYEDGSQQGIFARRYDASGVPSPAFQVNTFTSFAQSSPAVAMDESGGFVIAWEGTAAVGTQITGRAFNSAGAPITGEFRVNSYTTFVKGATAIARDPNGTYIVAWEHRDRDGHNYGVFGRRLGDFDLIFQDGFEGP